MAITNEFSGNNASWASEYSLIGVAGAAASNTTPGVYQLFLDLSALASGDTYAIRIYEKARNSAGTQRIVVEHVVVGAQSPPIWAFPSMTLLNGWDMRVICTAGTNTRSIDWSVRKVA